METIKAMYKKKMRIHLYIALPYSMGIGFETITTKSYYRAYTNFLHTHTHTHISVTLYTARFFLFCLLFFSLLLFSFFLKVYDFGGCDFAITNRLHAFHSVSHFYCGFLSNCLSISFFSAFIPIKNLTFTFWRTKGNCFENEYEREQKKNRKSFYIFN